MMVLIPDRKLFLLFTACLAVSVISAPIPPKYGSLENPADPAPLLRGPDGKPVDMSKWPWKRDLERRGPRLTHRDSARGLKSLGASSKPGADATNRSSSEGPGKPVKEPDADADISAAASITKPPQSAQQPLTLPLARRAPEGPADNSDLKVIGYGYAKRSQLNTAADALERRFNALDNLMTLEKRRAVAQNDLERRWMLLDEWEELDRRVTDIAKLIDESIRLSGGYRRPQRKSRRPRDADSATTPGALCSLPGAHCGPATTPPAQSASEPAPVPIERRDFDGLSLRSLFDLDLEELERRIDNMEHIFDEAINLNGGHHKARRKSSRSRDADSATTQGALCNLPGAHCARSYIPEDGLTVRDLDLDEYVEDIARRLLQVRRALASDGSLPVLHSANPSFMFESALRDAVHPHGLPPASLEGSTAPLKDQLAAAARERAAKGHVET